MTASYEQMTDGTAATKIQRDVTEATRVATAATTAAGKAVRSATVKAAQTTIDATVEATKSVTAATTKAATEATTKAIGAATGTATNTPESFGPAIEDAKKQVQEVIDTVTAQTKGISLAWLDAYDSGFAAFLELGKTTAGVTQVEALTSLAEFNASALTEINATFTKAARELLQ